jgi:hypothetical protein
MMMRWPPTKEGDMTATNTTRVPDMRSYVSPHVFDGKRPISPALAKRLQARYGKPAPKETAPARHPGGWIRTMGMSVASHTAKIAQRIFARVS